MSLDHRPTQTAIRADLAAIFVSLELIRSVWLITSLSPGAGETMSKHATPAGVMTGLLMRFAHLGRAVSPARRLSVLANDWPFHFCSSGLRHNHLVSRLDEHGRS